MRRYQIFISSTFTDLKVERQRLVESILTAGHIPAGMELFAAENEAQLKIIQEWISSSDAFCLLLGGRYGSIEPNTGLSYVELEYKYASSLGKPIFSIVLSDSYIESKVNLAGYKQIVELNNQNLYADFKKSITSYLVSFVDNIDQIERAVFPSLRKIEEKMLTGGWVRWDGAAEDFTLPGAVSARVGTTDDVEQQHNYSFIRQSIDDSPGSLIYIASVYMHYWLESGQNCRLLRLLESTREVVADILLYNCGGNRPYVDLLRELAVRFPHRIVIRLTEKLSDVSYIIYPFTGADRSRRIRSLIGLQQPGYLHRPFIELVDNHHALNAVTRQLLTFHSRIDHENQGTAN